jgi:hypothetical protein
VVGDARCVRWAVEIEANTGTARHGL